MAATAPVGHPAGEAHQPQWVRVSAETIRQPADTPIFRELAEQWAADGRTVPGHGETGNAAAMTPVPPGDSGTPS